MALCSPASLAAAIPAEQPLRKREVVLKRGLNGWGVFGQPRASVYCVGETPLIRPCTHLRICFFYRNAGGERHLAKQDLRWHPAGLHQA